MFYRAPKYPSKIKLEKEENAVLEARHVLYEQDTEDSQSESSKVDEFYNYNDFNAFIYIFFINRK
jgi:hypothetical protein